jgi:hypothetical protein
VRKKATYADGAYNLLRDITRRPSLQAGSRVILLAGVYGINMPIFSTLKPIPTANLHQTYRTHSMACACDPTASLNVIRSGRAGRELLGRRGGPVQFIPCTNAIEALIALIIILSFALTASAQCAADKSANELLRAVIAGELKAELNDHTHWRYQVKKGNPPKEESETVVETGDGDINRLRSVSGQPLTPERKKQEDKRIEALVQNPDALRKLDRAQKEDARRTEEVLRILPSAVTATCGEHRNNLVEILFQPNPDFHPSTHEASVFHAMNGRIWIDAKQNRLSEIDGHLTRKVEFGGGLLGHLDKGGEFHIKQTEVAPGHWEMNLMHVNMHGRALFFKTIGVQQNEERTGFLALPDHLTPAQIIEELRK